MVIKYNPNFVHHQERSLNAPLLREIVFGVEDGLVSTMGAVTGIALATSNHYIIVLTGLVIVAVESISMAVGSYISNKSEIEVDKRKLYEEEIELEELPAEERLELEEMYLKDGWPAKMAGEMATEASKNKKLFLQEMAYRELRVFPDGNDRPVINGLTMGISYIIGGSITVLPYLIISDVKTAIIISVSVAMISVFLLGVFTTRYSKRSWWKAGLEMLILAGLAAIFGYAAGQFADKLM